MISQKWEGLLLSIFWIYQHAELDLCAEWGSLCSTALVFPRVLVPFITETFWAA